MDPPVRGGVHPSIGDETVVSDHGMMALAVAREHKAAKRDPSLAGQRDACVQIGRRDRRVAAGRFVESMGKRV